MFSFVCLSVRRIIQKVLPRISPELLYMLADIVSR